jgi:predicted dehydrogenase
VCNYCTVLLQKLIAMPFTDIVYIGTRHPTHVTLSIMMLEAGKNVLCEKPMALSSADVKKVIEVAERKKLLFVEVNSIFVHLLLPSLHLVTIISS